MSTTNSNFKTKNGLDVLGTGISTVAGTLQITGSGTVTTSTPILSLTQTWNNVATTFVADFINITDTTSAAASLIADWQISTVSKYQVTKAGNVYTGTDGSTTAVSFGRIGQTNTGLYFPGTNQVSLVANGTQGLTIGGTILQFSPTFEMRGLKLSVQANTAGVGAPSTLNTASDGCTISTNEGATAKNYRILPSAASGLVHDFVVQDADGIRVTAASGDTIRLGTNVTAAAGYIESTTVGSIVRLVAINVTEWVALYYFGVWTDGTFTTGTSTGGGLTWTTISSANVATAVTNTGYFMETAGVTRTVTLPASVTAGFNISVNASGGSVRIVSNGNTIDGVGSGNDLLLADGNTAVIVAKATGSLEIVYGGTSAGTLPAGGSTGQLLKKNSATDFDYSWATIGALTDGDKGDITVSASGATWTIDNTAVTLAKMADMATASFIGRNTAATGVPEVLSVSTVRTMLSINNVENTALSTWAGTTNITTVGDASGTTQTAGNDTTKLATTAFVQAARDPRLQSVANGATITAAADTEDMVIVTAQNTAFTIANPTGTPVQGQKLMYRFKDNGTARGITYGSNFRAMGVTLPSTTVLSKTLYLGCVYNSTDTKWDVIAVGQEA